MSRPWNYRRMQAPGPRTLAGRDAVCHDDVRVLGCPIHRLSLAEAASRAERAVAAGEMCRIVVVNAAKLVAMRSNTALRESVLSADVIGADGVSILWAARLLGTPLPGRVNGTDLMTTLLERSDAGGFGVFFLGARPEVLRIVIDTVRDKYPGIRIAGFQHGLFESSQGPDIVAKIRQSSADILLIALPTPAKELWARDHQESMGIPVIHGVGGSFDVFAGAVRRAPEWMQRSGLEWLFRFVQEPRRLWKRYLVGNTVFLALLARELLAARLSGARSRA